MDHVIDIGQVIARCVGAEGVLGTRDDVVALMDEAKTMRPQEARARLYVVADDLMSRGQVAGERRGNTPVAVQRPIST